MCPCALCQSMSLLLVYLLKYSSAFLASPHQHYNLLFHSSSISLLTFQFFPILSLAISSPAFCPPVLFICPLFYSFLFYFPPPLFSLTSPLLLLFIIVSHLCMRPDFWIPLATVHDWFTLCLPDSNICRRCPENCKKCTSSNICTECKPGMR